MDHKDEEVDSPSWKSLIRIHDSRLRHSNREDVSRVYGDILMELQIQPENYTAFFDSNIRPFRNKKDISILIAKGDDDSLLKVSKTYVMAYGGIGWGKDRRWLLKSEELDNGKQPLNYSPPRVRKEGDHDRFYQILGTLWRRMRGIVFEQRPRVQRSNGIIHANTTQDYGQRHASPFTPPMTPPMLPARQDTNHRRSANAFAPVMFPGLDTAYDRPTQLPRRWLYFGPLAEESVAPGGYWPASRTEEVIINAVADLVQAQRESHPEIFKLLWHRHLARLEEIEQFGEQESRIAVVKDVVKTDKQNNNGTDETRLNEEVDGDEANISGAIPTAEPESSKEEDIVMADSTEPNHPMSIPLASTITLPSKPPTTDRATNTDQVLSHSDHRRPKNPPTFPLTAYIPPTIPNRMTVYITPYAHTAMHHSQPWIWPDAPVHPTSYIAFRDGIRLRAKVPDSVPDKKMSMVFGYGWDDFCCVVTGEESWRDWFIRDLRFAGQRGGVGVWRMRVCVVDVGGGGRGGGGRGGGGRGAGGRGAGGGGRDTQDGGIGDGSFVD